MLKQVLLSAIAVGFAGAASAETLEYTDTIGLATTNWSDSVSIPKFDDSLGDLISVSWELTGHVEGSAKFESLDAEPTTVTMNLAAEIELFRPDLTPLVVVLPLADTSDGASAFDGIIDFAGTSGKTYDALAADDGDAATSTDAADLALFTGVGDIVLPCDATGASTGSGAGNLVLQFATSASAEVKVIYEYITTTPTEESTWTEIKTIF